MEMLFKEYNLYTLLWCLYYLQGTVYEEGGILSKSVFFIFAVLSLYYYNKVNKNFNNPKIIIALNILVVIFAIYGTIRLFDTSWSQRSSIIFLKTYELSILPIFAFYYFGRKQLIDDKWFFKVSILFIIVALLSYRRQYISNMENTVLDAATNNAGYLMLALFPITVFMKSKPFFQFCYLTILTLFLIYGMKRGAILIGSFAYPILMYEFFKRSKGSKNKLFILIFSVMAITIVVFFIHELLFSNEYFNTRIEQTQEGNSSNRDYIYASFYTYFIEQSNFFFMLFGNGADGSIKLLGTLAHNDWLEIAIDLGLMGVLLYAYFWYVFFLTWRQSQKILENHYSLALGLCLLIYFFKSLFSMSINGMTLYSTSVLGYCIAKYSLAIQKNIGGGDTKTKLQ